MFLLLAKENVNPSSEVREVMHAGTYPVHRVHVSGGHAGELLTEVECPSHLCELTAFIHLSVTRCFVCRSAESAHAQSLFLKGLTMSV